jgi:outer membrane protein
VYSADSDKFWAQMRHNSREYVGLSMNIPIFNRRATRNNIRSAQLSARSQRLALTEAELALRKEIEQAWYNADAAYSKYRSAGVALASAEVAFAYEQQKAESGRSTIFDFNDAKTRMEKAESELVQAKYEFVFRSKILDFYRGKPLKL